MYTYRQSITCITYRNLFNTIIGILIGLIIPIFEPVETNAQTNFIPMERGEYKEVEDRWAFSPGLELSGEYRGRSLLKSSGQLPAKEYGEPSPSDVFLDQDLRLKIRSTAHRMFSINLELETFQEPINNADIRSQQSTQNSTESQEVILQARQAYLEYNPNPKAILKLGKHEINVGDRRGKIFSGILTGFSESCTAGTWCFEIGALKLAQHPADWLYYGSLDYPFFYEVDEKGNPIHILRVEVFRIKYTERNIPLGINNVPAPRTSSDEDIYVVDQDGNTMYYDAHEQEYWGLRFVWETKRWFFYADAVANQGNRRYHLKPDEDGLVHNANLGDKNFKQTKESIAGVAGEIELSFRLPEHTFTLMGLYSRGDRQKEDTAREGKNYLRILEGYYEIAPGSYQGTRFYFNGKSNDWRSGTGLGHSINNTVLGGFRYRISPQTMPFFYEIGLYELQRDRSILNENGVREKYIGTELNNMFSTKVDKYLTLDLELNAFLPGGAFSFDDHSRPFDNPELITHFVGRIRYSF